MSRKILRNVWFFSSQSSSKKIFNNSKFSLHDSMLQSEKQSTLLKPLRIGFIGGGQMATALCKGILSQNTLCQGSSIIISDNDNNQLKKIKNNLSYLQHGDTNGDHNQNHSSKNDQYIEINDIKIGYTLNNEDAVKGNSDIVILAVKPQTIPNVLEEIRHCWTGHELVISIAAGVKISEIESYMKPQFRQHVIRVMPNTPAIVGAMAAGVCSGTYATNEDLDLLESLLLSLGVVKRIDKEDLLDVVTGLSGSGPAYVYMLIEALADGGVKCGLHRRDALELAIQTVYGSSKLVKETNRHPCVLKDEVTSPGGTTITGIMALEKFNFRYSVMAAVEAATIRSKELGIRSHHLDGKEK